MCVCVCVCVTVVTDVEVTVSLVNGKINADLYVKPADTHQYLHSFSYHPFHYQKGIPYSQTLLFNRICSDSISFD